jgi:hypothetical protein
LGEEIRLEKIRWVIFDPETSIMNISIRTLGWEKKFQIAFLAVATFVALC